MPREFKDIANDLRPDGALRDFYIRGTNRSDWNAFLSLVKTCSHKYRFTVYEESRGLPESFEAIENLKKEACARLSILVANVHLNCHFFCCDEIELDFRPEDFNSPEQWLKLSGFFQEVVDLIGKPGIVTNENTHELVIDRLEPQNRV